MPRFFRLWIAKGGEEDEGREEESSLQLLTHVLATAITDINELWVKHVKLSHRSSWSPCVSESVKRKQNLDGGEGKSLSLSASYRARHEIQVRSRVRANEASGDSSSRSAMVVSPTVLSPTGASRYQG